MATSNAPVENASNMSYVTIAELTLSETIFALASILAGTILYGNQLLKFSQLLQNGKYAFIYAIFIFEESGCLSQHFMEYMLRSLLDKAYKS